MQSDHCSKIVHAQFNLWGILMHNLPTILSPVCSWPHALVIHGGILPHMYVRCINLQCRSCFVPSITTCSGILLSNVYQKSLLNLAKHQLHTLVNQLGVEKNNMYKVSTEYYFKLPSLPENFSSIWDILFILAHIQHLRGLCWNANPYPDHILWLYRRVT
jgi:hypothetical protein